ncbi:glycosyltransferase [Onishia niordana]|uniref:glycosyltransferase n=1 Tax=Onishia niordana TaxID=2508711 RepID=UPI00109F95C7|nr:glycosyltransferase [Halomonas niordiana]
MKAVFVHDHVFFKSIDGEIYSASAFPSSAWQRYIDHFDKICVIGRYGGVREDAESNLVRSGRDEVEFNFVSDTSAAKRVLKRRKVFEEIRRHVSCADSVIVRLPSENGLMALKVAEENKIPYAIEVVGCVWDALWNYGSILAKLYAPIAYFRMRAAVRSSPQNLYVTNWFLQKRYPSARHANAVAISNVSINPSKDAGFITQRPKTYESEIVTIGLIGNFKSNYKGIDTAVCAVSLLLKEGVGCELKILGSGDAESYKVLSEKMGVVSQVEFSGSLPNGEPVLKWISSLDVYIQPSRQEGLPRALLEAMSCGKLCGGSTAGGIPELLPKEYLHKPGDHIGLKNVILNLINLESPVNAMLENYNTSLEYAADSLDKKRYDFYSQLRGRVC